MDILGIDDIAVIKKSACLFELIVNPVYPMPNLEKMLSACHESNVTMGIISNAQFYTKCLFEWFLDLRPEQIGFHPALTIYSYIGATE